MMNGLKLLSSAKKSFPNTGRVSLRHGNNFAMLAHSLGDFVEAEVWIALDLGYVLWLQQDLWTGVSVNLADDAFGLYLTSQISAWWKLMKGKCLQPASLPMRRLFDCLQ